MRKIITKNSKETQKLGENLSDEILCGKKRSDRFKAVGPLIACLSGDLGSGKTTFTQGLLKGLGAEGPFTSPTFLVMKQYKLKTKNIYHLDCYRVNSKDILDLGWEEIISNPGNIIIIEWAERVCDIIPSGAVWIEFKFIDEKKREITLENLHNKSSNNQIKKLEI